MIQTLNQVMEFGHVVEITDDGKIVIDGPFGLYAPECYVYTDANDQIQIDMDDSWSLVNGFSGQYCYSGPIMHPSEFIGGGMERHILENPGYYVSVIVTDLDDPDSEPAGWGVAFQAKSA